MITLLYSTPISVSACSGAILARSFTQESAIMPVGSVDRGLCLNWAVHGKNRSKLHGGLSTGPKWVNLARWPRCRPASPSGASECVKRSPGATSPGSRAAANRTRRRRASSLSLGPATTTRRPYGLPPTAAGCHDRIAPGVTYHATRSSRPKGWPCRQ
jgi:hypothetical protein